MLDAKIKEDKIKDIKKILDKPPYVPDQVMKNSSFRLSNI